MHSKYLYWQTIKFALTHWERRSSSLFANNFGETHQGVWLRNLWSWESIPSSLTRQTINKRQKVHVKAGKSWWSIGVIRSILQPFLGVWCLWSGCQCTNSFSGVFAHGILWNIAGVKSNWKIVFAYEKLEKSKCLFFNSNFKLTHDFISIFIFPSHILSTYNLLFTVDVYVNCHMRRWPTI